MNNEVIETRVSYGISRFDNPGLYQNDATYSEL